MKLIVRSTPFIDVYNFFLFVVKMKYYDDWDVFNKPKLINFVGLFSKINHLVFSLVQLLLTERHKECYLLVLIS